jgi:hypothetical protein
MVNKAVRDRRTERNDTMSKQTKRTNGGRTAQPETSCLVIQDLEERRRLVVGKGRNCCAELVALESWLRPSEWCNSGGPVTLSGG